MNQKPSKFWAYIAVVVGGLLIIAGVTATFGYFGLPILGLVDDVLSYQLGQIAAIYLGLGCGTLAVYHGLGAITKRASNPIKLPSFFIFWIVLALVLGLGNLILNFEIAPEFLFPPLFMLGAALSTFAVLAWSYRKMGWPITWRQAALAFVSGSTISILVANILESSFTYLGYLLLEPFWYLAEGFADIGWGTSGVIERLFASPLILVFLAVIAVEAPIPEEFAKWLGIPMFGRGRIKNERQAFAIGLASGAGFAILENMLYEGMYAAGNGWTWGGVTLLRSIGSVLHPIGTGILALGWFRMKEGGAGKLFKAYLVSVGLHTLWNGGFEPLLYLTGLEYFSGEGPSIGFYGETLSVLLVGYLILLSAGLWWMLRRIVGGISLGVQADLAPASVSRRSLAAWAVACAAIVIPVGAAFGPAWNSIQTMIVEGRIQQVTYPTIGTPEEARRAFASNTSHLKNLATTQPNFKDIILPGDIYTYRVDMNRSAPAIWSYNWCTTTQEILDENFENIQLEFMPGDTAIPTDQLIVSEYKRSDGARCRQYYTVVTKWPRGRHQLEIRITFAKPINNGWDTYPAGTHFYRYVVTVKR